MNFEKGILIGIGILVGFLVWGGRTKFIHHRPQPTAPQTPIADGAGIRQTFTGAGAMDTFPPIMDCGSC